MILLVAGCNGRPGAPVELRTATAADVLQAVRAPGARAVLVNMWATWCVPCRQEFPELMKLARHYRERGLRVVLVSWDAQADDARRFLSTQGVDFPSYIKDAAASDPKFIEAIEPRWSGVFPATMIYDGTGRLRHFWEGKASYAEFEAKVLDAMKPMSGGGQQ